MGGGTNPGDPTHFSGIQTPPVSGGSSLPGFKAFDTNTGKQFGGNDSVYSIAANGGAQVRGVPDGKGNITDKYGQIINLQTGLTSTGEKPFSNAADYGPGGAASRPLDVAGSGQSQLSPGASSTNANAAGGPSSFADYTNAYNAANPAAGNIGYASGTGTPSAANYAATVGQTGGAGQAPSASMANGVNASAPGANPPTSAPPGSSGSGYGGINTTGTTQGAAPTSQTFGAGNNLLSTQFNAGAAPNRYQQAMEQFQNYKTNQSDPLLKAQTRDAIDQGAALGRTQSGMLRTNVGNLDLAQGRDLNDKYSQLLNNATNQQQGDWQRQLENNQSERGYQQGMENQAYGRNVNQWQMGQQGQQQNFNQALQSYLSDPAHSGGGANGFANFLQQYQASQATPQSDAYTQWLKQQAGGH